MNTIPETLTQEEMDSWVNSTNAKGGIQGFRVHLGHKFEDKKFNWKDLENAELLKIYFHYYDPEIVDQYK